MEYYINKETGICNIKDSYQITDRKEMYYFVRENLTDAPFNCRTAGSYVREWRAHNFLYKMNIMVESTKDTDLDIGEPL